MYYYYYVTDAARENNNLLGFNSREAILADRVKEMEHENQMLRRQLRLVITFHTLNFLKGKFS